jgi:hypothetical protein
MQIGLQPDPGLLEHARHVRARSNSLIAASVSLRHRSHFLHSRIRWVHGRVNDQITVSFFHHRNVARLCPRHLVTVSA